MSPVCVMFGLDPDIFLQKKSESLKKDSPLNSNKNSMNSVFYLENYHVKTRFSFHTENTYYQKTGFYASRFKSIKLINLQINQIKVHKL